MNIKLLINSYIPSLTKSEKKVAEYILNSNDEILYYTLQDISKKTGVGEATVMRFCNKIGFEKFANLKLLIAKETIDNTIDENLDTTTFVKESLNQTINNTSSLLSTESLNKAVNLIEQTKRIWFFGVGSSGLSALQAEANFARIGILSKAISDPHFQAMSSSCFNKDDLVIAFSISGSTKDIYDSLVIAKDANAKIIVITNYIESPLSLLADCTLLTAAKENLLKGGSVSGSISQLMVIDALKSEYIKRNEKIVKQRQEKTAKSILNKSL